MPLLLASGKLGLCILGEMRIGQNHQRCSSHFWSARYFSVEGDGTHSRGASFYSAGGRLGFARASVGSIPCMLGHPVPQAVLLPYLLLYRGHTGPFPQLPPSPTLSKGLQFPTALHSSPQMREAAPWEVDIVVPEKASYMKENAVPTSKTGFQRRSDGLCPLTHKNRIQHLLCMLTTKDFKR